MKIYLQDSINGPLRLEGAPWDDPHDIKPHVKVADPSRSDGIIQGVNTYIHYRGFEGRPVYLLEAAHSEAERKCREANLAWQEMEQN
jgi:hypothetical protein